MIEGGIKEHQNLERFIASSADIAPKDQIDLMACCWFSLTPGRTEAIQHEYVDARSGQTETVRITGSGEHGIATTHDQDLLIYAISQRIEAKRKGLEPSRRIHFTPYQFLAWMNREPGGGQYQRLKDALHRLKMTSIQTTIRSESGKRTRNSRRVRAVPWPRAASPWPGAAPRCRVRAEVSAGASSSVARVSRAFGACAAGLAPCQPPLGACEFTLGPCQSPLRHVSAVAWECAR